MVIKEYGDIQIGVERFLSVAEDLRVNQNDKILHMQLKDDKELKKFSDEINDIQMETNWRIESTETASLVYTAYYIG